MPICTSSHVKTSGRGSEKGKLYLKHPLHNSSGDLKLPTLKSSILFSLVRILTKKDISVDSLNFHPELTHKEEPASLLA